MDYLPADSREPPGLPTVQEPPLYEKYEGLDSFLSEIATSSRKLDRAPRKSSKGGYDRKRFLQAIEESFELVGGVPRLAIWADQNYTEFVKLVGKTIPQTLNSLQINNQGVVQIVSPIPKSSLDDYNEEEYGADGLKNVTPKED